MCGSGALCRSAALVVPVCAQPATAVVQFEWARVPSCIAVPLMGRPAALLSSPLSLLRRRQSRAAEAGRTTEAHKQRKAERRADAPCRRRPCGATSDHCSLAHRAVQRAQTTGGASRTATTSMTTGRHNGGGLCSVRGTANAVIGHRVRRLPARVEHPKRARTFRAAPALPVGGCSGGLSARRRAAIVRRQRN